MLCKKETNTETETETKTTASIWKKSPKQLIFGIFPSVSKENEKKNLVIICILIVINWRDGNYIFCFHSIVYPGIRRYHNQHNTFIGLVNDFTDLKYFVGHHENFVLLLDFVFVFVFVFRNIQKYVPEKRFFSVHKFGCFYCSLAKQIFIYNKNKKKTEMKANNFQKKKSFLKTFNAKYYPKYEFQNTINTATTTSKKKAFRMLFKIKKKTKKIFLNAYECKTYLTSLKPLYPVTK